TRADYSARLIATRRSMAGQAEARVSFQHFHTLQNARHPNGTPDAKAYSGKQTRKTFSDMTRSRRKNGNHFP
ncbi:hypothetical protein ACI3QN_13365, partial [Propionibacterium freudenreichii]|uniref:hypothetical protein n=1 Tax=Propionibacterium freudenreichii TaxID=1744 RepID=UPI003852BA8B